jgi:hypothetical protein
MALVLIDTALTMPAAIVEEECQRRIRAIHAVIAFCDVEEGSSLPRCPSPKGPPFVPAVRAKGQERPDEDDARLSPPSALATQASDQSFALFVLRTAGSQCISGCMNTMMQGL